MSPRTFTLLALVAAPLAAQEVDPPPPDSAPPPGVELFDSVQLIVNNDCITHSDLLRLTFQMGQAGRGDGDLQKLFRESIATLTRELLLEQAGRDMGYDPPMIQATVRREVQAKRERIGSATALAQALDASRMDSELLRDETEAMVYRVLYERAITGVGEGPGGRSYVDRYVRPGKHWLEFRRQGSRLDLPPIVHLQEIIVAPEVGEDLGSARQRAFLVRSRAQRGEDFVELNRQFGVPTKRVDNDFVHEADLEPIEEPRLASRPEVLEFVRGAQAGDISEPLPATVASGRIGGWRLLRLVERVEGVAQRFEDRAFQESLRERLVEAREEYEIERALRRLMAAAYIWPPPPQRRPEQPVGTAPQGPPSPEGAPEVEAASESAPTEDEGPDETVEAPVVPPPEELEPDDSRLPPGGPPAQDPDGGGRR
ncbi:MAG TPA: hypothetical protein VMT18_08150 [Planctomycetota bacterium]|nr:hypothetical protein [Planctomycetota bacterium]